jgi:2-polyprenyl-3-methyl-5-hydroxy-6-metoxy-1,4-benzoquinol methylase
MEEVNDGIVREFQRYLPPTGRALDVGCGRAALGAAIRNLGWEVWGIEQSAEACETARTRLDGLIEADLLDYARVRPGVDGKLFDALIFSDVLEHVYDPLQTLESYLSFVKPGGSLIVSVPNAVVWTNRFQWFFGRVRYADTGIMDRTHIRFFTFRTARELVAAAGCEVSHVSSTPHLARAMLPLVKRALPKRDSETQPDPRALIESRAYQRYLRYVYPLERAVASLWPTMLAFRIVVRGTKPANGKGGAAP